MSLQFAIIHADYTASAVRAEQYPKDNLPEIAFVGRSNVGKSSLINSLARRHGLARVSGTPGKTATLNYYRLTAKILPEERIDFFLVDLPGYGYARKGQEMRRQWTKFIEEYLTRSPQLRLVCQLIDMRHPPMDSDIRTFRWLREQGLPVQVVATKADKLSRNELAKQRGIICKELGVAREELIAYSSINAVGRDELLDQIQKSLL